MALKLIFYNFLHLRSALLIEPLWHWNVIFHPSNVCNRVLLIEPLWHWNLVVKYGTFVISILLIEPLWHWNSDVLPWCDGEGAAFNRTTVALKHGYTAYTGQTGSPFNRTTVALKQLSNVRIEDVDRLLIEPLWHWNQGEYSYQDRCLRLLIEPLWHWNILFLGLFIKCTLPFNRTTVALKLGW